MNIVILDGYASNPGDLNWDLLEQLGNVTVYPRTTDEEKIERAKDADIILINKVQIDSETRIESTLDHAFAMNFQNT